MQISVKTEQKDRTPWQQVEVAPINRRKKFRLEPVGEISGKCRRRKRIEGQNACALNLWAQAFVKTPRQQAEVGPADRQQVAVGPADRQQVAVAPRDRQQVRCNAPRCNWGEKMNSWVSFAYIY